MLQPDGVVSGALAPVEAALDELQRRICRLVLEVLLVELQVRFQVGMGVRGGDTAYVWGSLRGMLSLDSPSSPVSVLYPLAPVHGSALAPVAVEPGTAGQCLRADRELLSRFLACAESRGPGAF